MDFVIDGSASLGARAVTVTTVSGTSTAQTFTIFEPPLITSFAAAPSILTGVQPSELSWSVNAASCSIDNGVGAVPCTGSTTVTPGSTRTYTLSATTAGATVTATADVSAGAPGRFVYAVNLSDNTASMSMIDPGTGALTAIGAAVSTGASPHSVAVDPSGRYAYVTNFSGSTISMYTINGVTGELTPNGGTVASANGPRGIVVDPTGRFVYSANKATAGKV